MNDELNRIKNIMREKRQKLYFNQNNMDKPLSITKFISKILIVIILTLFVLIGIKTHEGFKKGFYKQVFNTNFSFATVNKWYQDLFGSPLPFKNLFKDKTVPVFNETLTYSSKKDFLDGVELTVEASYLTPALDSGIVIFLGEKENYGNTVIIQQTNGIDVWYSNISSINVSLYDFIEKGSLIGEVSDSKLYLVFEKNGEKLNYNEYIK